MKSNTNGVHKRGIYLVANHKSEALCANLIYSIRSSGCALPIRLIPFGGSPVQSAFIKAEAELVDLTKIPPEAQQFIDELQSVLTDCPRGFLLRFLAWFGDWDEFIYSDNDVVALCNWEVLFTYLSDYDLVHADKEYTTAGRFNYNEPDKINDLFGPGSLESLFTAGHFATRRHQQFIDDISQAIQWFKSYSPIPKKHDQSLLHIASLLGKWKLLNLCKPPYNWLSSWAGDYVNGLQLVQGIQSKTIGQPVISHIHYSGGTPSGTRPIDDFLFANRVSTDRLRSLMINGLMELSGVTYLNTKRKRILNRFKTLANKKSNYL